LHTEVASVSTIEGLQVTWTEVIVGGANCTVTDAVPDFVASCVLVAVTVTVPVEGGAVKSPLAFIVPSFAENETAEL
jgi:hypothetical protein